MQEGLHVATSNDPSCRPLSAGTAAWSRRVVLALERRSCKLAALTVVAMLAQG